MSLPARSVRPRRSIRERMSPARRRSIASGLIRMSERSTAIERGSLLGAAPASGRPDLERREFDRGRLDGSLAVRTDLPEGLERRLAVGPRLLRLRRAHGTDEEIGRYFRPAHRAVEISPREPFLHRTDLELALAHVLEVLRRTEEHVDERPEVRRNEAEDHGHRHEQWVLDPASRVLVHPVADREPEDDQEEEEQVPHDVPRPRGEEV